MSNASVDLSEIRENLSRASLYGDYVLAICPFHDDENPSFFVNEVYYNCMGCGANGDSYQLLDILSGHSITLQSQPEIERVNNPFMRWAKQYGGVDKAMIEAYRLGSKFPNMLEYYYRRGLTTETVKNLKLGWLDGWFTFPIFNKENLFEGATARLDFGKTRYMNPAGQDSKTLYVPNWKAVLESNIIYLVFGIFDAVSLYQSNVPVITPTTGISISSEHFEDLRKIMIVIPDKGEEAKAQNLVRQLGWRGKLFVPAWDENEKDLNDVLADGGTEKIEQILFPSEKMIQELGF